jgi:uncharacterized glyoxalase superfamily protein PhnB
MMVTPYLFYEDVLAAVDWLCEAYGFRESLRYPAADGRVTHAEMEHGGETIMVGHFAAGYQNPRHTGYVSQLVFVSVEDVQAHYVQAKRAGAKILTELEDKPYGQRQYTAEDPEGHRWIFGQQVRDVLPEEWGAVQAQADVSGAGPSGGAAQAASQPPSTAIAAPFT